MINLEDCENKTDEELVGLTLENQDYFLCLMKRYEDKLKRYILRISSFGYEDAEDILQEVYIKVYQNLNDFDSSLKFSSWIYRITHNHVISSFRKKSVRPEGQTIDMDEDHFNNLASDLDVSRTVNDRLNKEILEKAMLGIDLKYREVLVLYFFEDRDYTEISDILKKPMGTIATLLNRAKKKLKERIETMNLQIL